jgi:uncharacterized protein HemY
MAKRIIGILALVGMAYLGYVKIDENMGNSDYFGLIIFMLIVVLFLVFLAVRKIITY